MSRIDYMDDDRFQEIFDRLQALENANPLRSASVSEGRTEFNGLESLIVNGSEIVNGLLRIIGVLAMEGTLNGAGTGNWTGPWNQIGDFHATGNSKFDGDVEITFTLKVGATSEFTGIATFKNDVRIENPGRILVGTQIVLEPVGGGGRITVGGTIPMTIEDAKIIFASGGELRGFPNGVEMVAGSTQVGVNSSVAIMSAGGGTNVVTVSTVDTSVDGLFVAKDDSRFQGNMVATGLPTRSGTGLAPGLVYWDSLDSSFYVIES